MTENPSAPHYHTTRHRVCYHSNGRHFKCRLEYIQSVLSFVHLHHIPVFVSIHFLHILSERNPLRSNLVDNHNVGCCSLNHNDPCKSSSISLHSHCGEQCGEWRWSDKLQFVRSMLKLETRFDQIGGTESDAKTNEKCLNAHGQSIQTKRTTQNRTLYKLKRT